jgi:hypothetical protein
MMGSKSIFPAADRGCFVSRPATLMTDSSVPSDLGVWSPPTGPPYLFTHPFSSLLGDRRAANRPGGNIYTVPDDASVPNFGIAHTGPLVTDATALARVSISTSVNYEAPEIEEGSELRPPAMPLVMTVRVEGLEAGVGYRLYRSVRLGRGDCWA